MRPTLLALAALLVVAAGPGRPGPPTQAEPEPGSSAGSAASPLERLLVIADPATVQPWAGGADQAALTRVLADLRYADPDADGIVVAPAVDARLHQGTVTVATIGETATASSVASEGVDLIVATGSPGPGTDRAVSPGIGVVDPDTDGRPTLVVALEGAADPGAPMTVVELLAGTDGIVAYRVGDLAASPDEMRLPRWAPPAGDAVVLDGAWWSLVGPVGPAATQPDPPTAAPRLRLGDVRRRLAATPVSRIKRVVDVSVGDVTGDGQPDLAIAFRRRFRPTLINASRPRSAWTDASGLSAHVGIYRPDDLSEVWVAGTLVWPVARLAACDRSLAVAYSTLRSPAIVATGAWSWQGFGFLPLPPLPGRGTPTCIDIDHDGRPDAAILERS